MRLPFSALEAFAAGRGVESVTELADRVGVERRSVYRWEQAGLTMDRADTVAVAFGVVPRDIWPEWDALVAAELDDLDAARRAKRAAAKREYRQRNPDYVERQRAARAAYYNDAGEYERARQRRYYASNAEAERARVRAYYAANAEAERARSRERYARRREAAS